MLLKKSIYLSNFMIKRSKLQTITELHKHDEKTPLSVLIKFFFIPASNIYGLQSAIMLYCSKQYVYQVPEVKESHLNDNAHTLAFVWLF